MITEEEWKMFEMMQFYDKYGYFPGEKNESNPKVVSKEL